LLRTLAACLLTACAAAAATGAPSALPPEKMTARTPWDADPGGNVSRPATGADLIVAGIRTRHPTASAGWLCGYARPIPARAFRGHRHAAAMPQSIYRRGEIASRSRREPWRLQTKDRSDEAQDQQNTATACGSPQPAISAEHREAPISIITFCWTSKPAALFRACGISIVSKIFRMMTSEPLRRGGSLPSSSFAP
jgi:hypothetical protein